MRTRLMLLVVLLAATDAAAQVHPDLSGRWVLASGNAAESDVARELTVQQVERTTSVLGAPLEEPVTFLIVDRGFATGSRIDRYEPVGVVGGTVEGLSGQTGTLRTSFASKWEGRVLVIINSDMIANTEREERWSIENAALILTVTTRANGSESTTRLVYRRP